MRGLLALCCVSCVALVVGMRAQAPRDADPLPRRAWFGVAVGPHERGAVVTGVTPGSPAAEDGVRVGDVITTVDDRAIHAPGDVAAAIGRHRPGESASLEIIREGRAPERRPVRLRPFPLETMTGATFEYASVVLPTGIRLRTIVSLPESRPRPLPALLFLQGGGCSSVDQPFAAKDEGPVELIRTATARGFVTMRVEKSGLGDSQGPPCSAIGYEEELSGYRAALAALKRHPAVDPTRVDLLGLSLGGFFAPIVARESPVRSIVAYGTLSMPPSPYEGRSERFFREIATVDVLAAWSAVDARVLALHGQFDEVARAADHEQIAAVVNARHPGRAVYQQLEGLDHCWTRHESMSASQGHCGNGQKVSAFSDAVFGFLTSG